MALEALYWHTPASVLLGFPLCFSVPSFQLAGLTLTYIRPANIEQVLFVQSSLTFFAPSFNSSYSCFAAHFFQYTDGGRLYQDLSNIFRTHIPHVNFCLITEDQCVPVRPFHTQIKGLTHHCSCRSSHLSPHLNFLNLPHPRFFLFVMPFTCPNSFCPILSGHCGKLFFHFKAKRSESPGILRRAHERQRLAQACQVLEQFCVHRFHHWEALSFSRQSPVFHGTCSATMNVCKMIVRRFLILKTRC